MVFWILIPIPVTIATIPELGIVPAADDHHNQDRSSYRRLVL